MTVLAVTVGLLIWGIAYLGWFAGRCAEASREADEEQYMEAAYEWARRHGKLPR